MSVIALLGEGFESALMACSLVVIFPGIAAALTARAAAIPAIASYSLGVIGLSWVRFSGRGGGYEPLLIAAALMTAALLLLVPLVNRTDLTAIGAGLLAGGAAAELWRPCVGSEFASVLNDLEGRGLSGLALMGVYAAGVLSPLIALGALHHLAPDHILEKLEPTWSIVGGTVLSLLALATALGFHERIISQLVEWSTGVSV